MSEEVKRMEQQKESKLSYISRMRIVQPIVWVWKLFKWLFTAPPLARNTRDANKYETAISDINSYIDERWKGQRKYHSEKSQKSQKHFMQIQFAIMLLGSISSLSLIWLEVDWKLFEVSVVKIVCGLCSTAVVFLTGFDRLKQYREEWTRSRKTTELLKSELVLFNMNAGDTYSKFAKENLTPEEKKAKELLFVGRVESIVGEDVETFIKNKSNMEKYEKIIEQLIKK